MEKKHILSFLFLTSLVASTANVKAWSWPWSSKPKTFTEKMYDGLCSVLRTGEDTLISEYSMLKTNMPRYTRIAVINILAGIAAKKIVQYCFIAPFTKIADWYQASAEDKVIQKLIKENDNLKKEISKKVALLTLPEANKKMKKQLMSLIVQLLNKNKKKTNTTPVNKKENTPAKKTTANASISN